MATDDSTSSPARILIIDDDPGSRMLLERHLCKFTWTILQAHDGIAGLQTARSELPDLVLLDIMMPGMDGISVCRELKASDATKAIPVIFLTARADPEDILEGFAAGGEDYLTKPFRPEELLARARTHIDLKRSRDRLAAINDGQRRFFSVLAHDLRHPLYQCRSIHEALLEEFPTLSQIEVTDYVNMAHTATERTLELLENLLLWGRAQMDQSDPDLGPIPLRDSAESAEQEIAAAAATKGITLENHVPDGLIALGDPAMVAVILRNLLSNAVKYTPAGGTVAVSAGASVEGPILAVRDSGIGMPETTLKRLFNIEQRISQPGTANEEGSGFGLKLCHTLAQRQGGHLWAESDENIGSCFYFQLPGEATEAETN